MTVGAYRSRWFEFTRGTDATRDLDTELRDGARAEIERSTTGSMRSRVLAQLGEQEVLAVSTRGPRVARSRLLAVAALVVVALGVAWAFAQREGAAPVTPRIVEETPRRANEVAWERALTGTGVAERALRLEAERLQEDSRALLRRLVACVRIGPAHTGG